MSNGLQMVKKKSKQLIPQNDSEKYKCSRGSIRRYCTEKKKKTQTNFCGKIKKNEYLRNRKNQKSVNSTTNSSNHKNNQRETSIVQNDIILYEIKPLSPTKLSICAKKFYNNNNFKKYEENLHLYDKKKVHFKEKTKIINNEDIKHISKKNGILNGQKPYCTKKKTHFNSPKPYDLIPQINKDKLKKKKKFSEKPKSVEDYSKECNINDDIHMNSFQSLITNETQTNEYQVEEFIVTQSKNKDQSIPVKRFYKNTTSSATNDIANINKDMPLISDTTFNSKADYNLSPISSKLNSSHKISLNVSLLNEPVKNEQQKVTSYFPIRRSARKTKNIVNEEKQIALEKAIISENEDGLKITVFPNKGRGVIADRNFTRGEYVVEYAGELVSIQEARKREAIYSQDTTTGCYMYYFKYGSMHYCIDATAESSRLGRLVNHSRFGNLMPKVVKISGVPRIVLIAKNDIKLNEELTYDYGDRSKKSLVNHPWLAY